MLNEKTHSWCSSSQSNQQKISMKYLDRGLQELDSPLEDIDLPRDAVAVLPPTLLDSLAGLEESVALDELCELVARDQDGGEEFDTEGGGGSPTPREDGGAVAERGCVDGLLASLSRIFEDGGCEWLERELCTGAFDPRVAEEEKKRESQRLAVDAAAALQKLQKQRNDRRCQRGECCLYSLWYNPEYANSGHRCCTHVHRQTNERPSTCGAPLLESRVLPELPDEHPREYKARPLYGGASKFASYARWGKGHHRRGCGERNQKVEAV